MTPRSWFRGLAATAAAVVFAAAGGSAALADNVQNDVVAAAETITLAVGQSALVGFRVVGTGGDGDPQCNLDGAGEYLDAALTSSTAGVAAATPSIVRFEKCSEGNEQNRVFTTVTALAAGTTTFTMSVSDNKSGGSFSFTDATFTVNVPAPAKTQTTTTVTCPTSATYTGSAQEPCTAVTKTPAGVVVASPAATWTYENNTNVGTATATATYAGNDTYVGSADSETFAIVQAAPNCDSIAGYTGAYDGDPHGASGSCTGVNGETLTGLNLGATFTDAPGGTANWSIPASTNYTGASGAVQVTIDQATPNCSSIAGYTGTYDGDAHGATGSCTGVNGETLTGLDLGGSFTNAPGGTAYWSIPASTNYTAASGSVQVTINQATPTCIVDRYTGTYDGDAHGATGSCTGVNGETLTGLDLGGSFTNAPGGTAYWSIAASTNYTGASGSVAIIINKADAVCSVTGYTGIWDGNAHRATGSCTGLDGETLTGLDLGASFTDVPGGTASWSFTHQNYQDESGSVAIVIKAWTLSGFYAPVDKGIHNTVKAGATVPLKFEVFAGATELTATATVKSFVAQKVTCLTGVVEDAIEEMSANTGTSLRYDSTSGQFIQNWQTPKSPGTCYKVTMTTQDDTPLTALFKLK